MPEKVKRLGLERDYNSFLYFIDGAGNVCRMRKGRRNAGASEARQGAEVVVPLAVERDKEFLYFIDRDGDIARSRRVGRKRKAA